MQQQRSGQQGQDEGKGVGGSKRAREQAGPPLRRRGRGRGRARMVTASAPGSRLDPHCADAAGAGAGHGW